MLTQQLPVSRGYSTFFSVREVSCYVARFDELTKALSNVEQLLSANEQQRQRTYEHIADGEHYALSHAFLRLLIAQTLFVTLNAHELAAPARSLCFDVTEFGKPALQQSHNPHLMFSLSRSRYATAICLGWNTTLGIDVESLDQRKHMTPALLDYAFSTIERRNVAACESPEEDALKLWTRKEAIMKADGRGLRLSPAQIETTLEAEVPLALPEVLGDPSAWGINTRLSGTEVVSVAIRRW